MVDVDDAPAYNDGSPHNMSELPDKRSTLNECCSTNQMGRQSDMPSMEGHVVDNLPSAT